MNLEASINSLEIKPSFERSRSSGRLTVPGGAASTAATVVTDGGELKRGSAALASTASASTLLTSPSSMTSPSTLKGSNQVNTTCATLSTTTTTVTTKVLSMLIIAPKNFCLLFMQYLIQSKSIKITKAFINLSNKRYNIAIHHGISYFCFNFNRKFSF